MCSLCTPFLLLCSHHSIINQVNLVLNQYHHHLTYLLLHLENNHLTIEDLEMVNDPKLQIIII